MGVINKICEDGAGISNMNKIIRLGKLELEKRNLFQIFPTRFQEKNYLK
jgi:hypothetical protein